MKLVVLAATALLLASAGAAARLPTKTARIATVSSVDFRADVVARRTSAGAAPTASVTVVVYRKHGTTWRRTGFHRLAGTYFWKTITAPRGLCRLELRTDRAPRVVVQLLESPSLGCARSQSFALTR